MRTPLNSPVGAHDVDECAWRSLVRRQAGDTVGEGIQGFTGFFVEGLAGQFEDLLKK